jgi:hypothetical protein
LKSGIIKSDSGESGSAFFRDGNECDFFYNPKNPIYLSYQLEPRTILSIYLADRFKTRDSTSDIGVLFEDLVQNYCSDIRIDLPVIQERATAFLTLMRHRAITLLTERELAVVKCVKESAGETEDTMLALLSDQDLLQKFQLELPGCIDALGNVPPKTFVRLIDNFPEEFMDGNFFNFPYAVIESSDDNATNRLREESKERILSHVKDALRSISDVNFSQDGAWKDEVFKCSLSLDFLDRVAVQ